jgi:hypothetical protein
MVFYIGVEVEWHLIAFTHQCSKQRIVKRSLEPSKGEVMQEACNICSAKLSVEIPDS